MIIYPDTSFLVGYLNEDDANYKSARAQAAKFKTHDFVVCEVHLLELPAAVRAAVHRQPDGIPEHIARRVINRFDRAVNGKLFLRKTLDLMGSVSMARSLGDAHGWAKRRTTFDLSGTWLLHGRCRQGPFSHSTVGSRRLRNFSA